MPTKILHKEKLIPGRTSKLVLDAPQIAATARPGHFVILRVDEHGERFPLTIADTDKEEALPLIRRFYNLGFNIEATLGTAKFLKENGVRTHVLKKLNEGSDEIAEALRQGHIAYVLNTKDIASANNTSDGFELRRLATENNVTMFTSLDTVRVLLDVLEETTITISTIDA